MKVLAYQYLTGNGRKIVYGGKREKHYLVCRALRNYFAEIGLGFFAISVTTIDLGNGLSRGAKVWLVREAEQPLEKCMEGGKPFSRGTKCSSAEAPSVIPPGGPVLLLRQQLRQVVAVAVLVMLVS